MNEDGIVLLVLLLMACLVSLIAVFVLLGVSGVRFLG